MTLTCTEHMVESRPKGFGFQLRCLCGWMGYAGSGTEAMHKAVQHASGSKEGERAA